MKPKFKVNNDDDENAEEVEDENRFEERNEDFYTALLLDKFSKDKSNSYEGIEEPYRIKPGHFYFVKAIANLVIDLKKDDS